MRVKITYEYNPTMPESSMHIARGEYGKDGFASGYGKSFTEAKIDLIERIQALVYNESLLKISEVIDIDI